MRSLRDLIPKALEGQKDSQKKALEDLQSELQSLKSLVINRTAASRPAYVTNGVSGTPPLDPGAAAGMGGGLGIMKRDTGAAPTPAPAPSPAPQQQQGLPFGGLGGAKVGGKPAIPAWQMAAAQARANSPAAVATPAAAATPAPKPSVEEGAEGKSS